MNSDPTRYSTIWNNSQRSSHDRYGMQKLYNMLIEPHTIIPLAIGSFYIMTPDDLTNIVLEASQNDSEAKVQLALIALTGCIGLRLVQSMILAKRDYSHLSHGFSDIIFFFTALFFISGAPIKLMPSISFIFLFYGFLALFGVRNFRALYKKRIDIADPKVDFAMEVRIQKFNTLIFFMTSISMFLCFYFYANIPDSSNIIILIIVIVFVLTALNMAHSHELSMRPRYLFSNKSDDPDQILNYFEESLSHAISSEKLCSFLEDEYRENFREIRLRRALRDDVPYICENLVHEFGYAFRFIFGCFDDDKIKEIIQDFLNISDGFCRFGYQDFYLIQYKNNQDAFETVGCVKLESRDNFVFYDRIGYVFAIFKIVRRFGFKKLISIRKQMKDIVFEQIPNSSRCIMLTYIWIDIKYRNSGFATIALNMISRAVLKHSTNGIFADRICLGVRERNIPAIQLFKTVGFRQIGDTTTGGITESQENEMAYPGRLIAMEIIS